MNMLFKDSKTSYGQLLILLVIGSFFSYFFVKSQSSDCNSADAVTEHIESDKTSANADATTHPYLRQTIAVRTNDIKNPVELITQERFVNWVSTYNVGALVEYSDGSIGRIDWSDFSLDEDGRCECEVRISQVTKPRRMYPDELVRIFDFSRNRSVKMIYTRQISGYAEIQARIIE
ncbi:hypothetical protein IT409_01710 [Candidatus Falkowbacteria bacterium]|nr:hypothetical protein [Candidatus Falkowbacteria bacterium]